jgi:hypothetical protein
MTASTKPNALPVVGSLHFLHPDGICETCNQLVHLDSQLPVPTEKSPVDVRMTLKDGRILLTQITG